MSRRAGFTLIELLVVLVVVGLLVAILLPTMQRARQAARSTVCASNIRQIGIFLNSYLVESRGLLPTLVNKESSTDAGAALPDLFPQGRSIMQCPSDDDGIGKASGTSYFWNFTINGQLIDRLFSIAGGSDPHRVPLISDKEGFHPELPEKVNILYADGRVAKELKFSVGGGSPP